MDCDRLDPSRLAGVERGLDALERVSLAFLLCEPSVALARCAELVGGGAATVGALAPDSNAALVEALLLIKAYGDVESLGIDVARANSELRASSRVHPMKRALYELFEELDSRAASALVEDFVASSNDAFELDARAPLELFALELIGRGAIALGSWSPFDRRIDEPATECDVYRLLKSVRLIAPERYSRLISTQNDVNVLLQTKLRRSARAPPDVDRDYPIHDRRFVGYLLIINNRTFAESELGLSEREGTERDVESLHECWSAFGFRPCVFHDLKHDQIESTIRDYAARVEPPHSAFAVCILSHGTRGAVYGSDSVPIRVDAIKSAINDRTRLVDKPKILIVQACRGDDVIEPVPIPVTNFDESRVRSGRSWLERDGKSIDCLPDRADTLIFWATVEDCVSYRDKFRGTWFIQDLCKLLMQRGDRDHLLDIFIAVTNEVSNKKLQICQLESTFRRKLQLSKIH